MNGSSGFDGPLFDSAHLSGFTGGDMALERVFIQEFCMNTRTIVKEFEACKTLEDWQACAHKMKGAARAVGVWSIAAWCEAAEMSTTMVSGGEKQAFFNRIDTVLSRLEEHVESLDG